MTSTPLCRSARPCRRPFAQTGFLLFFSTALLAGLGVCTVLEVGDDAEADEVAAGMEAVTLTSRSCGTTLVRRSLHSTAVLVPQPLDLPTRTRLVAAVPFPVVGHCLPNGLRAPLIS